MAEEPKRAEPRISTPLVLAASSAMLAVAAVIYVSVQGGGVSQPQVAPEMPDDLHIDDRTPEAVSQSFYDAWRRRRWDAASRLSVGHLAEEVEQKRAADAALPHEQRIVAERTWDALAHAPLTLGLDRVDILPENRYEIAGTAEYLFVNRPYRRRVEFDVVREGEAYRVEAMRLGEVLTELPAMFQANAGDAP
ncbi:MAG: hypothetical protein AB7S26_15210 [Sandaracinaceae bacterium]